MKDKHGNAFFALMKLGQKAHMEQFRKGQLYMNTLTYFRDLEADPARADRLEGVSHIFQPSDLRMSFDAPGFGRFDVAPEDLAGPVTLAMNETYRSNVFCLTSISDPVSSEIFPSKHEWFGESLVLILNTGEFIRRVVGAAKLQGFAIWWQPVTYYDDGAYTGKLGHFSKAARYSYQKEFRFVIQTDGTKPVTLDVGDISDITSEVIPFEDADKYLKFKEADAREAELTW